MPTGAGPALTTGRSLTRRRLRVNGLLVLAGVAALHLVLLMLLQGALRSAPVGPWLEQAPALRVRMLPPPPVVREAPPAPIVAPPARPARRALRPTATAPLPAALPASAAASAATSASEHAAAPPGPAGTAASAPPGDLLDSEAARRAIREAARRHSTAEMGAMATDAQAPLSAQQRLGQEIARGALGECLKGEFAGSGMGLLSLPFWLIAEMRDKCRR